MNRARLASAVEAHALPPSRQDAFPDHERRLLLRTPGISHGVVSRIEREGVCSLRELIERGIDTVVDQICLDDGNLAWRNRRRALARALAGIETMAGARAA